MRTSLPSRPDEFPVPRGARATRAHRRALRVGVGVACVLLLVLGAAVALAAHATLTAAQAPAAAAAIELKPADVPTLKVRANPTTASDRAEQAKLTGCIGETPSSSFLSEASSQRFDGPSPTSLSISSTTQILPSMALVTADLTAIHRRHALACLARIVGGVLRASAPKGATVSGYVGRLRIALPSADGVAAFRVVAIFHIKRGSSTVAVPAYVDSIGFAFGQAEVALDVSSVLRAPSASLEKRLVGLLVSRAQAAIG
jgi:hypothetical protein